MLFLSVNNYKLFSTMALLISLFLWCKCNNIVVISNDPRQNPFRTQHFVIQYDTTMFSAIKIWQIGLRKEYNLKHINTYLQTNYEAMIETIITDTILMSYVDYSGTIYETSSYVLQDQGHEIVHVVTLFSWGITRNFYFLREGIAEAAKLPDGLSDAFELFQSTLKIAIDEGISIDTIKANMKKDIVVYGAFEFTNFEYNRAGAFVHYLKIRFGLAKIKQWYCATLRDENIVFENKFTTVFNASLDSVINDFFIQLQKPSY